MHRARERNRVRRLTPQFEQKGSSLWRTPSNPRILLSGCNAFPGSNRQAWLLIGTLRWRELAKCSIFSSKTRLSRSSSRPPFLSASSTRNTGPDRAATAEPVGYPTDWATNITNLRRAVQKFQKYTAAYRNSQTFLSFLDLKLPPTNLSSSTDSEYETTVIDAPRPPKYFNTVESSSERRPLPAPSFSAGQRRRPPAKSQEPPASDAQLPKVESSPRAPSFSPISRQNTPADHEPHSPEAG